LSITPTQPEHEAKASADAHDIVSRTVDLNRENELITWQEWMARSMAQMKEIVPAGQHENLAFRITLLDGRAFAVKRFSTYVVKGRCSLEATRWSDHFKTCNVVTGYMFYGLGEDMLPSSLCVPPDMIASIECVLVPIASEGENPDEDQNPTRKVPFGFYPRETFESPLEQKEVEEEMKG